METTTLNLPATDLASLIQKLQVNGATPNIIINVAAPTGNAGPAPAVPSAVTVSKAIAECLTQKKASGVRPCYWKSLRQYFALFARLHGGSLISSIDEATLESWFNLRGETPASRASNLGRLGALFQYAWRRKWISENPIRRMERVRIDRPSASFLTVEQCEKLMRWVERERPDFLAWLTLALFAGIRPNEADQLTWKCVDLDSGTVTVDAAASKVHKRRIVNLRPAALAWMKHAHKHVNRRRRTKNLRLLLGFDGWPKDILRHTAASYWMSVEQDAGKVADELGNSPMILLTHYRALVTKAEAEKFWNILPTEAA
jgi:integrase